MAVPNDMTPPGLDHVVLAGGTPSDWVAMSASEWSRRLADLSRGAAVENAHWVTLLPHHGNALDDVALEALTAVLTSIPGVTQVQNAHTLRFVWRASDNSHIIIDPCPDGHVRFAATVEGLRKSGTSPDDLTEDLLSHALLTPAENEADLVLILGSPERIPDSMVWELAYSELVFIDIAWSDLNASHLELAIDDFNRRHRRFGGLDS